jgi:hypothetical protein
VPFYFPAGSIDRRIKIKGRESKKTFPEINKAYGNTGFAGISIDHFDHIDPDGYEISFSQ